MRWRVGVGCRPGAAVHDGRLPTPVRPELVEAFVPRDKGFDRLSPNGDKAGLRYLSPNGSLRTVNFRNGPIADGDERAGFSSAPPGTTLRQRKGFCLLRYGRTWLKKTGLP